MMRIGVVTSALWASVNGASLTVEHALAVQNGAPVYSTRGVLTYGEASAAFDQNPLTASDAEALKV